MIIDYTIIITYVCLLLFSFVVNFAFYISKSGPNDPTSETYPKYWRYWSVRL